jgi:hypothetical protein
MNSSRTPLSPARTDPNCGQAAANGGASDAVSAGARGWRRSRQRSVGARGWKSSGRRVRRRLRLEAPSCEHIGGARLSAGKGVGGFQRRWWRRSWSCKLSACTSPSIDPLNEIMELPTKSAFLDACALRPNRPWFFSFYLASSLLRVHTCIYASIIGSILLGTD